MLCKGKTNFRIRSLQAPVNTNISFQAAEKGSYRQANILKYLETWLEPWTDARAAAKDWRVIMMDVAGSHVSDEVVQFCHARGYVCLYHYGCTTGIAQINDTDLHQELEAIYLELEMMSFHNKQMWDPADISRSLQEVVDDLCAAWRTCNHSNGVRGHKRTGLTTSLDGSDDNLITREARMFWQEAGMPEARLRAIAEIDKLVSDGVISGFNQWRQAVSHPEAPGVVEEEGAELEAHVGENELGELLWECDEDLAREAADNADVEAIEDDELAPLIAVMPGTTRMMWQTPLTPQNGE